MSRKSASLAAGLLALAFAGPAAAQELKAGSYACSLGGQAMGVIEIEGGQYRVSGNGSWRVYRRVGPAILWDGALGPISAGGEIVGSTLSGGSGFDIQIKARDGGKFQLVRCRP